MLIGNTDVANMGAGNIRHDVVAVADDNPSTVAARTTDGGATWTSPSILSDRWGDVAYNGSNLFVAVARTNNDTATSVDGITWTSHAASMTGATGAVCIVYGAGTFVAFENGLNKAYTSTDGVNWTQRSLPAGVALSGETACFGGSSPVFFACAQGTSAAATSPDGITWTSRTMSASLNWNNVAWNGSVFCAVNQTTTASATSPDGITWTARTVSWAAGCIESDGTQFVATQFSGTGVATSPDGINWTTRTSAHTSSPHAGCLVWNGKEFLIIVNGGGGSGASSPDGIIWTANTPPSNGFQGACAKNLTFGTF